jgi:hypothetical protein
MKLGTRTESNKLYEEISRVSGRGAALEMTKIMLTNSMRRLNKQDKGFQRRVGKVIRGLLHTLKTALPDTNPQLIGDFVADLEDLWEYGQKLDNHIKILCSMKFPKHSEHLREILLHIEHEQCDESWAHIKGIKNTLPQLLSALNRQSHRSSSKRRAGRVART